jgi:hypothetical protein
MDQRFFCIIYVQVQKHLIGLSKLDVDVFQPTARITEKQEYVIEGLLMLEQVAMLIDNGYRVLVEEDAFKRARAFEVTTSTDAWVRSFERK